MSRPRLVAGTIARITAGTGAFRFLPGSKVSVDADVLFGDPDQSVIAAAAKGLGQPVAACAITLGPRRFNRKPVVQLIGPDATTVGFLKVGADPATSEMVSAEAAVVDQLNLPAGSKLEIPRLLWQSEWHDRSAACFGPVGRRRGRLRAPDAARRAEIATAVVDAWGGPRSATVHECEPLVALRVESELGGRSDIEGLIDRVVARFGEREVSIAGWHGDFSPWNMISTASNTGLLDWEFAGPAAPVGADLLHHRVMVATHLHNEPGDGPLGELLASSRDIPELAAMGIAAEDHALHLLLYLLELIRRDLALARAAVPVTGMERFALMAAETIVDQATV